MDRETGPFGLTKQFSYQEVLRAIQQQPYDIPVPARVGLRTWDDPFYQNMIQDQASYQGDVAKSGFSHEAPFQPPPGTRSTTTPGRILPGTRRPPTLAVVGARPASSAAR